MPTITFVLSCDQKKFKMEFKHNQVIAEVFRNLMIENPEYHSKLQTRGMACNGRTIDPNNNFMDALIKDGDVIQVLCDLKSQNINRGNGSINTENFSNNNINQINNDTKNNKVQFKEKVKEPNVFYLTYKTTKENEKISLISNSKYEIWDNEKKEWKICDSFYSVNKSSLSITICSSSEKVTSNE